MEEFSLVPIQQESISSQLITIDGLEEAILTLQNTLSSVKISKQDLGADCIAVLTRVVKYESEVFESHDSRTRVSINYCSENSFPVIGIDLWSQGAAALPGGMFLATSDDEETVARLINSVRKFGEGKTNGSD